MKREHIQIFATANFEAYEVRKRQLINRYGAINVKTQKTFKGWVIRYFA